MKTAAFAILFLLASTGTYSQSFSYSGVVIDKSTGKSLEGASIFFSNTSYGTVSKKDGSFIINNISPGKYDLVVSSIGYQTNTNTINLTASIENAQLSLAQKATDLNEVKVRNYLKDGWKEWGNFFLENFIGTSALSNECQIKNTKAIRFSFSKKDNQLIVDALEPLMIENKALGYNIQYQLESFTYNFNSKLLFYGGYALFSEMEGSTRKKRQWKTARATAFEVSQMRFMRSLFRNRLNEDGYQLYLLERIPNIEQQRLKAKQKQYYDTVKKGGTIVNYENTLLPDSTAYFNRIISQKDPIEIVHPGMLKADEIAYAADSITAAVEFKQYIIIRYPKRTIPIEYASQMKDGSTKQPVSSVITLVNYEPIYVTASGYYYNFDNLISEGFWGWWEKISTILPFDYKPGL